MKKRTASFWWAGLVGILMIGATHAQLVVVDDAYGVPASEPLLVEQPGVLDNDSYNGEPAVDGGARAVLISSVRHGVLTCASDPGLELCPDGSFDYSPDPSFGGIDSFVYEATAGGEVGRGLVTLSACEGGPTVFMCWKEAAFLIKLGEMGYSTFQEGFEDDAAWSLARSPFTAPSVISQGVKWETNWPDPPASNEITTGSGPALTGTYGVFDSDHGYATGTPGVCDINDPPLHCLYKDGVTGTREPGETTLYGAAGHFRGSGAPNLVMILDGGQPISLGRAVTGPHVFYGVIDTTGFTSFRVEDIDGKVGQAFLVFADDFLLGTTPADTIPPQVLRVNSAPDTGDGELSEGELTDLPITRLEVSFSEVVRDHASTAVDSVTNPANFLLFSDRGDGFDTIDCLTGFDTRDVAISVDTVSYVSGSAKMATLELNGGLPLPPGAYRLLVCGTTTIRDGAGNPLDGDGDGIGGEDFQRNFTVTGDPPPGYISSTLRVEKSSLTADHLTLSWSGSCSNEALDYAIYEGTLGRFDSHVGIDCFDDGADLTEEVAPQAGSSYFLMVPISATQEGSYGVDSSGTERPVPADPLDRCLESQTIGGC